jgi:aspartate/methionine/tyrosine aminotransferase
MAPKLSSRSAFDLSPNPLSRALAGARAAGRPILDLTESNPTRASLPYPELEVRTALADPLSLKYEPAPFGLPTAREAVARELTRGRRGPLDPARVVLTASTSEAYAFLFKLLCEPGDEVLVPRPSYPLFEHLAQLEAVRAVPYRLAYDGSWHVDLASVRVAVTPRTRAVVVVSPNNPTGSYMKTAELDALAALGLPIVSDEVFAEYPLKGDATRADSALDAHGAPLVFALGGLSKLAAMPQMKVAWIAVGGREAHVQTALGRLEVIADAFLSVGTPVQRALPALLASRGPVHAAILARARDNLASLRDAVARSAVSLLDVEGGWYATLRLPRTRSELEWVLGLLEHDDLYVHPGHFFDFEDEAFAVVSLLTPEPVLREGIRRLVSRVTAFA